MGNEVGALLRRSPLRPGESLASLLARLAALNAYDPPSLLDQIYREGLNDSGRYPRLATVYERLAAMTMIAPVELYRATAHRFAPVLTSPRVAVGILELGGERFPLLDKTIFSSLLRIRSTSAYCPRCLAESPYYHLEWALQAVAACVRHECLLVDHCPQCGRKLTIEAIVSTRCARCAADLTAARPVIVAEDALGLFSQQIIRSWLFGEPLPETPLAAALPTGSPQALYWLVEGLQRCAAGITPRWPHIYRGDDRLLEETGPSAPAESYRLYATACRALVDWPEGFCTFLHAYRSRGEGRKRKRFRADLGPLYSTWLRRAWKHQTLGFIQEAFGFYLGDYLVRLDQLTLPDIAQLMEVNSATAQEWVSAGLLTPLPDVPGYFSGAAVREFGAQYVTAAQAAELRGVARDAGVQWVARGQIRPVCGGLRPDGRRTRFLFLREDVDRIPAWALQKPRRRWGR